MNPLMKAHTSLNHHTCDLAVIGGGIVGLAVAQEFIHRYPNMSITLLEKESKLALHQTGHNSGVVHAGLYYPPESTIAKLCVEGLHSTYAYCDHHSVKYKKCGKLVVATCNSQLDSLQKLYERSLRNKVPEVCMIEDHDTIVHLQPGLSKDISKAIFSPQTGVVNWRDVALKYADVFIEKGGQIFTNFKVDKVRKAEGTGKNVCLIGTGSNESTSTVDCDFIVNCAGLYSDRVANGVFGGNVHPKIIPIRGEYYILKQQSSDMNQLVCRNIYPVPDPKFPFLGVHFTPRLHNSGDVWVGPNAILACSREGYSYGDVNVRDLTEILTNMAFLKFLTKHWKFSLNELHSSMSKSRYLRDVQQFFPGIKREELLSRDPVDDSVVSGVRAQAMLIDGTLTSDLLFDDHVGLDCLTGRVVNCRNAASPAATSSIPIGRRLVDYASHLFKLPHTQHASLY